MNRRVVLVLSLCLTLSFPLLAQVYESPETDAKPAAVAMQPAEDASAGMLIAIDPVTGALRQPTAAEAAALTALQPAKAPKLHLEAMQMATGGIMIELDDSYLDYLTVRIDEAGHLHSACVRSEQVDTVLRLPVRSTVKLEEK